MKKSLLFILSVLWSLMATSQVYPVQTSIHIIPPYSTKLSDYLISGSEKLVINLLLSDLQQSQLDVSVSFKITGPNIELSTNPEIFPSPVNLIPGVPVRLSGTDLMEYLSPENLICDGIVHSKLIQSNGKLPEGFYRFEVEITDYQTNRTLASQSFATAWLILNNPPLINQPAENSVVRASMSQSIHLQWTPRHMGSPNSAFSSSYILELYEIIPENSNPNLIIQTTSPVYQCQTSSTSLIYGADAPVLIPGQQYAIVVKAHADNIAYDLFRNDGYSEARTFTYGVACHPPENILTEKIKSNSTIFTWEQKYTHSEYRLRLKEAHNESAPWHTKTSFFNDLTFPQLKPNTKYQYQLQSICDDICSEYSDSHYFKTLSKDTGEFKCKDVNVQRTQTEMLGNRKGLFPNDLFTAADFKIRVKEAQTNGKYFNGTGSLVIPLFNNITVPVSFEEISLSSAGYLKEGKIVSLYNSDKHFLQEIQNDILPTPDSKAPEIDTNASNNLFAIIGDTVYLSVAIDTLILKDDGIYDLISDGGDTIALKQQKPLYLADESGQPSLISQNSNSPSVQSNKNNTNNIGGREINTSVIYFGPVEFIPDSMPKNIDCIHGTYKYKNIPGKIHLELHSGKIKKSFSISNVNVSYDRDTLDNYSNILISWKGQKDIGEFFIFRVFVKQLDIGVDIQGNLTGNVILEPYLTNNKNLGLLTMIKGISGKIDFNFEGTNSFTGNFDYRGMQNVNIHFQKENKKIIKANIQFENDKVFFGKYTQLQPVIVSLGPSLMHIKNMSFEISFEPTEKKLKINTGSGDLTLTDVPGISGTLPFQMTIDNGIYSAIMKHTGSTLFIFGMEVDNPCFEIKLDSTLSIEQITGSLKSKHPKFNTTLNVASILIENGRLKDFDASGNVIYEELNLNLTNCTYQDTIIRFNAKASYDNDDFSSNFVVNSLSIDTAGNIVLDEVSTDLVTELGPVRVVFESSGSMKRRSAKGLAKIYIAMKDARGKHTEVMLNKASVEYKRKRNGELKNGLIEWEGNHNIGDFNYFNAFIKKVHLIFESINGKEIIKGDINLSAYLNDDRKVTDYVIIRKGINGEFGYSYRGNNEDFSGRFDFSGIKDINIDIVKTEKILASIKEASFNQDGLLKGTFTTENPVSYNSGGFSLRLEELSLGCSLNVLTKDFKLLSGTGEVTVQDIAGVNGTISLGLIYLEENFEAIVETEKTKLAVFSMNVENLNLTSYFDSAFNFSGIEGSVSVKHDEFDAAFDVNEFKIYEGKLHSLHIEGSTTYKGFSFELRNAEYRNDSLLLSAKVAINASGSSSWFDVDNFRMSKTGDIKVGKIAGDLNLSKMHVSFAATFNDNAFKGTFNGDFLVLDFEGALDIGSTDDFNFGYLALNAETNIPFIPGFKITDLGGKIGYNYHLDFTDPLNPVGNPMLDNYVAGFKIGIGDNANLFILTAEPTIQFGGSEFEFNFTGTLDMPRNQPVFKGMANIDYLSRDNSFSGNVGIDCTIPSESGRIVRTENLKLAFYRSNSKFTLEGTNMSATVLSLLEFTGNISYERKNHAITGEAISIHGEIKGAVNFGYDVDFDYDFGVANINGGASVDLGAQMSASFSNTHCQGSFGGYIDVEGNLELTAFEDLFTWQVAAEAHANATITYSNEYVKLNANANFMFETKRKTYKTDYNFNKTWELDQQHTIAQN